MTTDPSKPSDRFAVAFSLLIVRVIVGAIFFAHGSQKLLGAFGGKGLDATIQMMGPIGYPVSIGEFLGGLGLMMGFLCRFSAASLIVVMLGAILKVHGDHFFLSEGGFEYNLALIGLLVPILVAGPGPIAIGRLLPLPKVVFLE